MVINESGLLAAMKDSYKCGGYHVALTVVHNKKCYLIAGYGYGWAAVIRQHKMPRKVLGLLAEHIGRLPEEGDAFLLRKDNDAQDEMLHVAINPIGDKLKAAGKSYVAIRRSRLTWDGDNVWQTAEKEVALIRPDLEKMIEFKDTSPRLVDRCLYVEGQVSMAYIHRSVPGENERDKVASLGATLWI